MHTYIYVCIGIKAQIHTNTKQNQLTVDTRIQQAHIGTHIHTHSHTLLYILTTIDNDKFVEFFLDSSFFTK